MGTGSDTGTLSPRSVVGVVVVIVVVIVIVVIGRRAVVTWGRRSRGSSRPAWRGVYARWSEAGSGVGVGSVAATTG